MAALRKMFSNVKLGKERECPSGDPGKEHDLKRSNARALRKQDNSVESVIYDQSVDGPIFTGRLTADTDQRHYPFLHEPLRSYSFEPGASVDNFETKLLVHSNRLQKKHKGQSPRASPSPKPLKSKFGLRVDNTKLSNSSNPKPLDSKFGLKVDNTKLSNLGSRASSALHLSPYPQEPETSIAGSNYYGRYGLVVHPSNLAKPSRNLGLHESTTSPQSPSSEVDPFEDARATFESWNSIPSLAERRKSSGSQNASARIAGSVVAEILGDFWDRYGSELDGTEWQRVVDYFNNDHSPAGSSLSFQTTNSDSSEEEVVFKPRGKGKNRQVDVESVSHEPEFKPRSFLKSDYAELLGEDQTYLRRRRPRLSEGTNLQDSMSQSLADVSSDSFLDELLAQGEIILKQFQEDLDRNKAVELENALTRERKEANRVAAESPEQILRDCVACADSKDALEFPLIPPTSACEHAPSTCYTCLEAWMASEFETKGCEGLKCPECPQTLDYNDVQEAASELTFEAYDRLATRNALGACEEFAWCLAAGCNSGQLNIDNNDFMHCANCGYQQCLRHKVSWHKGETCEQYEYRTSGRKARDEEKATEKMIDTVSKRCPGPNCGWRIQKTEGCEHMTCRKCKHQFCWQCLASHSEIKRVGNTAHEKSCKFHSKNLDISYPFNAH